MKNWVDEDWEIHDANGCMLRGTQDEMMFAWNVNYLNDNAFKELYGSIIKPKKLIIKGWKNYLKLINIVDKMEFTNYSDKD